jgi:hypothetical protein
MAAHLQLPSSSVFPEVATRIGRLLRYHVEDIEHFIQSQRASGKRRAV